MSVSFNAANAQSIVKAGINRVKGKAITVAGKNYTGNWAQKSKDGSQIVSEYTRYNLKDVDGKLYNLTTQYTRSVNPKNGDRYLTKIENFESVDKSRQLTFDCNHKVASVGNGTRVTNSYFDNNGNKKFETEFVTTSLGVTTKARTKYKNGVESAVQSSYYRGKNPKIRTDRLTVSLNPKTGHPKHETLRYTKFDNHGIPSEQF